MTALTVAIVVIIVVLVVALLLLASVRVVRPDERGIVFRYGRALPGVREPGTTLIVPGVDRLHRVSMETRAAEPSPEEMVTRDHVTMRVGAVIHVRVTDPVAATLQVADHLEAVGQLTVTMLRNFIGHCDFDELAVSHRDMVNTQLYELIAEPAQTWGVAIERVEIVVPDADHSTMI